MSTSPISPTSIPVPPSSSYSHNAMPSSDNSASASPANSYTLFRREDDTPKISTATVTAADLKSPIHKIFLQVIETSGEDLKCGFFSLALSIRQFDSQERHNIYLKMRLNFDAIFDIEKSFKDIKEYEKKLGEELVKFARRKEIVELSNISFQTLKRLTDLLDLNLVLLRGEEKARYTDRFSELSFPNANTSYACFRSPACIAIAQSINLFLIKNNTATITITADSISIFQALEKKIEEAELLIREHFQSEIPPPAWALPIINKYKSSETHSSVENAIESFRTEVSSLLTLLPLIKEELAKKPLVVIWNRSGNEDGGHYESINVKVLLKKQIQQKMRQVEALAKNTFLQKHPECEKIQLFLKRSSHIKNIIEKIIKLGEDTNKKPSQILNERKTLLTPLIGTRGVLEIKTFIEELLAKANESEKIALLFKEKHKVDFTEAKNEAENVAKTLFSLRLDDPKLIIYLEKLFNSGVKNRTQLCAEYTVLNPSEKDSVEEIENALVSIQEKISSIKQANNYQYSAADAAEKYPINLIAELCVDIEKNFSGVHQIIPRDTQIMAILSMLRTGVNAL